MSRYRSSPQSFSGCSRTHRYRLTRFPLKSLNTSKSFPGGLWNSTQTAPPNTSIYLLYRSGKRARISSRSAFFPPTHAIKLLMGSPPLRRRPACMETAKTKGAVFHVRCSIHAKRPLCFFQLFFVTSPSYTSPPFPAVRLNGGILRASAPRR